MGILLSFTACFSPRSIIRMEPDEQHYFEWNYGRQVVFTSDGDLTAKVMYDTHTKKYLIFDVEIINNGQEKILVSPEKWWIEPIPPVGKQALFALDPEAEILNLDIKTSRQEAAAKNAALAAGAVAVAATVAAATSDNSNSAQSDSGSDTYVILGTDVYAPFVPVTAPASVLPPEREFWESFALRKTTVPPTYKVGGKVVFPRHDAASKLRLHLPVNGHDLQVTFQQRLIKP